MNERSKALEWIWPSVLDVDSASKAARQGFYVACLMAAFTALGAVAGHMGYMGNIEADLSGLLDALLFAVIAFGIFKYSRVAAVAGLALYFLEKVYVAFYYGPKLSAFTLIIILGFVNGIRGVFAYRKIRNQDGVNFDKVQST